MDIRLNEHPLKNVQYRPLSPTYQTELGYKVAVESTKANGLDEIFFEQDHRKYVLYSDNLDLSSIKQGTSLLKTTPVTPSLTLDGKPVQILRVQNETNATTERFKTTGSRALSEGIDNGIGGALGGVALILLKLGAKGGSPASPVMGAVVGFVSGFAWGAGGTVFSDLKKGHLTNMDSIDEITEKRPGLQKSLFHSD
jgi:hypothetical protein